MIELYEFNGAVYPDYLKRGNVMQFIAPFAAQYCQGRGLDVGAGRWPLPGANALDLMHGDQADDLPDGPWDYIFSSHCLEHVTNPVLVLEHWYERLLPGGTMFAYLPHPDMRYWRPQFCRKHLHSWTPQQMVDLVTDIGFENVLHSERDLAWSFAVVGFKPRD